MIKAAAVNWKIVSSYYATEMMETNDHQCDANTCRSVWLANAVLDETDAVMLSAEQRQENNPEEVYPY